MERDGQVELAEWLVTYRMMFGTGYRTRTRSPIPVLTGPDIRSRNVLHVICDKNGVYGFYFASCMNIIFNELRYVHTTYVLSHE